MATEKQVKEQLEQILMPGIMRSINDFNLVREIAISGQKVKVSLASTALPTEAKDWLKTKADEALKTLSGVAEVDIEFIEAKPVELNKINHIYDN